MKQFTVALVGTPNVGKSTLFNGLTGLRQKVGNFPGVTVEPMVGTVQVQQIKTTLIDLPGIYGLTPSSKDEELSVDVLRGTHPHIPQPDAILLVMNANNPEKCLVLFSQLAELGLPITIAATMIDAVKLEGGTFDDITLMHKLGASVQSVVGSKGLGVADVKNSLTHVESWKTPQAPLPKNAKVEERYKWADEVIAASVIHGTPSPLTQKLDAIFLHPVWGSVAFVIIMTLFFQSIFTWAAPLMDGIEASVKWLQDAATLLIDQPMVRSFFVKGLLGGVGSVIVFLPQILILNLLITVLEECGYLARAAFVVDRFMGLFGLQGRSFIPLLGSFACAIPGIMSARIIPSYTDRMATIMATPLMTCSARLPVYTLLIAAVIPASTMFGFFSLQSVVMASLYVVGALSGLLIALLLKRTLFRGSVVPFLIEFPPYRMPSLKSVGITVVGRSKDFLKMAGTIILAFSIVLWILTEFPRTDAPPTASKIEAEQMQIENSYAAQFGKTIQPVFAPIGFDWKITLGVLSSFAARETFISAMGQIYASDVTNDDSNLRTVIRAAMPLNVGLSILAFYVYALQCVSTMAIMKRETGHWRWPALAFAMTFVLAYTASFVVYRAFG
ncbi:MAG: ferrous iron transporter B [Ignavibacteria bacterium]|nr:ferrous iron transporter B [Ignavibacteria bacterium]